MVVGLAGPRVEGLGVAEADAPNAEGADLNVGKAIRGDDDAPALVVFEGEQAAVGDRSLNSGRNVIQSISAL